MMRIDSLFWSRVRIALLLLAFIVAFWAVPVGFFTLMLLNLGSSWEDRDFKADHVVGDHEVGTALRLPEEGIFGKARFYVIVVRDKQGRLIDTLYEGPGAYPEVPKRPTFVAASDMQITYQIPDEGERVWEFPALGERIAPELKERGTTGSEVTPQASQGSTRADASTRTTRSPDSGRPPMVP